jgi:hypothetical protein
MMPDPKSKSDPRSFRGGVRLVIGGVIAVALVAAILMLFAGDPNPQQGESLPNAPPQGSDVAR